MVSCLETWYSGEALILVMIAFFQAMLAGILKNHLVIIKTNKSKIK